MTKHNTIQVDYTISENNYQLKSLLNIDSLIPKDDYYICKNNKKLYVSGTINGKSKTEYKSKITCYTCEDCSNFTNPEGRKLRMNRSIQAEGAFAQVKQNMQFKRFLSRGNKNVLSDGVYFYILKVNFPYQTLKNTLNLS